MDQREIAVRAAKALSMSLEHVVSQGKTLHPDTLAALREYEHE